MTWSCPRCRVENHGSACWNCHPGSPFAGLADRPAALGRSGRPATTGAPAPTSGRGAGRWPWPTFMAAGAVAGLGLGWAIAPRTAYAALGAILGAWVVLAVLALQTLRRERRR